MELKYNEVLVFVVVTVWIKVNTLVTIGIVMVKGTSLVRLVQLKHKRYEGGKSRNKV